MAFQVHLQDDPIEGAIQIRLQFGPSILIPRAFPNLSKIHSIFRIGPAPNIIPAVCQDSQTNMAGTQLPVHSTFRSEENQPTLCPRLLMFNQKSASEQQPSGPSGKRAKLIQLPIRPVLQTRKVVRETQDPIPRCEYHAHLEDEIEEGDLKRTESNTRCWSDTELTEGPNYDNFQPSAESSTTSVIANDIPTSGGFSHAFLTSFSDKFLKASTLNFSFISGADPNHAGVDNLSECAFT
ncbi:hypothetical protein BDR03DRAFT_997783 [Suillus americanus]|nr:hypothetical protein BDR03DRAFT_997783 [Suillus americanus]